MVSVIKGALAVLLIAFIPHSSWAVEDALVSETSWSVGAYEGGVRGAVHPVPWEFHSNGTVNAGNLWTGTWKAQEGNTVSVAITHQSSATDSFEVNFLTPRQFVAFKNGRLYRYGQRR